MKKLTITSIFFLLSFSGFSQVLPYFPPRTPATGQVARVIQDNDLRARFSFWMPYTNSTTPAVRTIDSVGSNVQLLSDGSLAISKGLGSGFFKYLPSEGSSFVSLSGGSTITPSATSVVGLNILAMSGQTGNLIEFRNSSGTIVSRINASGSIVTTGFITSTSGLINGNTSNNGSIAPTDNGVLAQRNINDSNPAMRINNNNASSTGNIVSFQAGGSTLSYVSKAGVYNGDASLSGTPTAPTAASGTNTTQIATTAFVQSALSDVSLTNTLTSSAITLSNTRGYYTFTGSSPVTWVLPTLASSGTMRYMIINTGSATLTINTNSGDNDIYSGGTPVNSITVGAGESLTLYNNTQYFIQLN